MSSDLLEILVAFCLGGILMFTFCACSVLSAKRALRFALDENGDLKLRLKSFELYEAGKR